MNIDDRIFLNVFIQAMSPKILAIAREEIGANGFTIEKEEGQYLDTILLISAGKNDCKVKFYFRNLILEIASIDVDESPLKFDHDLLDTAYFEHKSKKAIQGRIKAISSLLGISSDAELKKNLENLYKDGGYKRIQCKAVDPKNKNKD